MKRADRDASLEPIEADLVVDCSGAQFARFRMARGSRLSQVEVEDRRCAGRPTAPAGIRCRRADQRPLSWWWKGIFLNPSTKPTREEDYYFALILPIEGDRFLLTLASWGGRALPADHESFAALCARLRSPIVAEALAISKPISAIFPRKGMRTCGGITRKERTGGIHRRRGRGVRIQSRLCAGHDQRTVCSQILGKLVSEMDPTAADFPALFYQAPVRVRKVPWELSVARDRQALGAGQSAASSEGACGGEAWERIMREGAGVPVIAEALFNVINLNRPPDSLRTDSEFLAAVNEIMQRPPKPPIEADQVPPYPPAAIAD